MIQPDAPSAGSNQTSHAHLQSIAQLEETVDVAAGQVQHVVKVAAGTLGGDIGLLVKALGLHELAHMAEHIAGTLAHGERDLVLLKDGFSVVGPALGGGVEGAGGQGVDQQYFRTARAREAIAMECTEAISNSKRTSVEAEGPQDIITPRIALFNIYDIDATCDSNPHRVPG